MWWEIRKGGCDVYLKPLGFVEEKGALLFGSVDVAAPGPAEDGSAGCEAGEEFALCVVRGFVVVF